MIWKINFTFTGRINTEIAALKLQAMGIGIDKLTQEQEAYLHQA